MAESTGKWQSFLNDVTEKMQTGLANRDKKAYFREFIDVRSTKQIDVREEDLEGMNSLSFWPEGAARPQLSAEIGYGQSYTQFQYAGQVDITKPMMKFDKKNLFATLVNLLMDAAYKAKEIKGHAYLEYGDVALASVPTVGGIPFVRSIGGNGLTLFHTAQVWKSGGATYANKSASLDDLTETAVSTARGRMRRIKDSHGAPLNIVGDSLLVPVELETKANKVIMSDKEPATANNAINVARSYLSSFTVLPWLSDTTDWYVKDGNVKQGGIKFYMGWNDEIERDKINPRTGNKCTSVDFSVGDGALRVLNLYKVTS